MKTRDRAPLAKDAVPLAEKRAPPVKGVDRQEGHQSKKEMPYDPLAEDHAPPAEDFAPLAEDNAPLADCVDRLAIDLSKLLETLGDLPQLAKGVDIWYVIILLE
ncbi:predicted protein [Nematostella vectensis]|uniref:Uncharacterized protein n=1 Tax=Nematostella vectensis TaxID=45351 RepID=A7S5Q5_NEMVE|nr:predicted protein [Nematostella vectensis]|eukprot:XP_001633008.1 predicted protein [Nematostella vectensis]